MAVKPLPDFISSGSLQGKGCAVAFAAGTNGLEVQRTNELGTSKEAPSQEALAWMASVLNATLAWRTAQGGQNLALKSKTRQALLKALAGGEA